jgi:hypothetical protein
MEAKHRVLYLLFVFSSVNSYYSVFTTSWAKFLNNISLLLLRMRSSWLWLLFIYDTIQYSLLMLIVIIEWLDNHFLPRPRSASLNLWLFSASNISYEAKTCIFCVIIIIIINYKHYGYIYRKKLNNKKRQSSRQCLYDKLGTYASYNCHLVMPQWYQTELGIR